MVDTAASRRSGGSSRVLAATLGALLFGAMAGVSCTSRRDEPSAPDAAALGRFLEARKVTLDERQRDALLVICAMDRRPIFEDQRRPAAVPQTVGGRPIPDWLRTRLGTHSQGAVDSILERGRLRQAVLNEVATKDVSAPWLYSLMLEFAVESRHCRVTPGGETPDDG